MDNAVVVDRSDVEVVAVAAETPAPPPAPPRFLLFFPAVPSDDLPPSFCCVMARPFLPVVAMRAESALVVGARVHAGISIDILASRLSSGTSAIPRGDARSGCISVSSASFGAPAAVVAAAALSAFRR